MDKSITTNKTAIPNMATIDENHLRPFHALQKWLEGKAGYTLTEDGVAREEVRNSEGFAPKKTCYKLSYNQVKCIDALAMLRKNYKAGSIVTVTSKTSTTSKRVGISATETLKESYIQVDMTTPTGRNRRTLTIRIGYTINQ